MASNTAHISRASIKTDIFKELLPNNTELFRAHVKQYSHFHRIITKQL